VKNDLKIQLARELAFEQPSPCPDVGIRAGVDPFHPVFRSRVTTSFASWNILELHEHRDVKVVAVRAIEEHGSGAGSGRFVGGITPAHTACEIRTARFFAGESALLFSSRNQAILTTITALCGEGSVVIGPALSALPLADACALVGAEFAEFEGEEELRGLLERHRLARRVIVVAEGLSSLTGRRLNATKFFSMLEQAGAWGIVDETAAIGHSGLRGSGSAEEAPTSPALLARLIGFSMLAAGELAALVGPIELRELLVYRSRYVRLETSPPTVSAAAVHRTLDLVEVAIAHRERLLIRSKMVNAALKAQGWSVVSDDASPLVAIWCESHTQAREVQEALLQRGIVVDALPARSLRKMGAVVRILLSTGHTDEEVARLMDSLLEIRKRLLGIEA